MSTDGPEPRAFGPYTILDELGRGGQAVVYLAEDDKLRRRVALKVVAAAAGSIPADRLERFRREAEAASKLDHPNICPVYDAGEVDGTPYIAMRFVEGETLAERLTRVRAGDAGGEAQSDETSDPTTRQGVFWIIQLIEKVARALDVAHERGLIHRDVKPGNIMVTPAGEPIVLDFGLARDELADDQTLTHSGDLLGTPAYMSPEQLMAQRIPLDRRTDVYSLGATLYECLTLERPYQAVTRAELYQRILTAEPTSAVSLNRQIPRDLAVVLQTAMDKDRNRRYQTAADLADDLKRIRAFEPIHARPIGAALRLKRWAQRHPALAVGVAGVVLALGIALYLLVQQDQILRRTRALALAQAASEKIDGDPQLGLLLAREAMALDPGVDALSQIHRALAQNHEMRSLGQRAFAASFSADGEHIVLIRRGTVAELLTSDGELVQSFDHGSQILAVELSRPGTHVLAVGPERIRVWDLDQRLLCELPAADAPFAAATFSPSGDHILAAAGDTARLWDLTGREVAVFRGHRADIGVLAFSPNGDRVLTAVGIRKEEPSPHARGDVCTVRVWHLEGELAAPELVGHTDSISAARFSPDGQRVVSASRDGTARVFDLQNGGAVVLQHGGRVHSAEFHPDGRRIVTACYDRAVRLWQADGQRLFQTWFGGSVNTATFSADGERIAAACSDTTIRILDLEGRELMVLRGHATMLEALSFAADGGRAVSTDGDGEAKLWRLRDPEFPVFRGHRSHLYSVEFSFDGRELLTAAGSGDPTAIRWDRRTGRVLARCEGHVDYVFRAAYSPSMDGIVTASEDGTAIVWDPDGKRLATLVGHENRLWDACFAPDGGEIATASLDGTVRLWNRQGKTTGTLPTEGATGVSYSADGRWLLVSGRSSTLWDRQTGQQVGTFGRGFRGSLSSDGQLVLCPDGRIAHLFDRDGRGLAVLRGHEAQLTAAKFSHRGDRIVTTSRDGTARIWDLEGTQQLVIRGHQGFLWDAAFSPDDQYVATCSVDGTARVWPINPARILELAEQRTLRGFRANELEQFRELLGDRAATSDGVPDEPR